jgi:tellurite resistance protein
MISRKDNSKMTLFDNNFSNNTIKHRLSPAESFAAIALLAVASDGYPSEEESKEVMVVLSRMKLFRDYSNEVMNEMFDKLLKMLYASGFNTVFESAKESLPFDLRESAFAVASDIALVDGVITQEEQEFLHDLRHYLGVEDQIANQIVEAMLVKNR